MPPKFLNLGKKSADKKDLSAKDENKPKIELPKNISELLGRTDILDEKNLLPDISKREKDILNDRAKEFENKLPKLIVEGVVFNILSSDDLDQLAVVNISNKISRNEDIGELIANLKTSQYTGKKDYSGRCYESEFDRKTLYAGSSQLLPSQSVTSYTEMGTVENNKTCTTCNRTNVDCPGHLGEIKLHTHFVNPLFKEFVIKILSCVCNDCSALLIKKSYLETQNVRKSGGKINLNKIYDIVSKLSGKGGNICPNKDIKGCKTNPKYVYSRRTALEKYQIEYYYGTNKKDNKLSRDIKKIEEILKNISEDDAKWLGFNNGSHPYDMILKSLPVIPPSARPYTIREGEIKEDHITTVYDEIIRDNHKYYIMNDENKKDAIIKDLYFHISHLFDNTDKKYCRSPTEKISGIKQRITKKEGLIRSNIMGKRVNFCGRSLIGPDSTLRFGEVSVPIAMAKVLTIPEMVHEKNLDYILDLWNKRQITSLQTSINHSRRRITDKTYNIEVRGQILRPQIGSIVERYIQDGDVVLVNRQPTLYKYSMIGNTIKINDKRKNIGIHMTETKMRNADFDGDEINIHVMQSIDARVEALTFANVKANIPSALTNGSMIGMMQNSVSGAYILTRNTVENIDEITQKYLNGGIPAIEYEMYKEIILTPKEFEDGLSYITYKKDLDTLSQRLAKHNINPLSGKALFSALLPKDFIYDGAEGVKIRDGILISGQIADKHISNKGGSIQINIWKWYGKNRSVSFITDCTFLTDWFIYRHGLTIGYGDVKLPKSVNSKIDEIITKSLNEFKLNMSNIKPIDKDSSLIDKQYRENRIAGFLQDFKGSVEKEGLKAVSMTNPLNIMIKSGAKGKMGDMAGIVGLKGQEMLASGRPAQKLSNGTRCLPYFDYNSEDIKARGFISNSFIKGMTPYEMYFLSEGGREGQLGTATGTAESGALSHKLFKVMEDCKVCYDGSVRNSSNFIYQFAYLDGYEVGELINTKSNRIGEVVSFINIKDAISRINAEFS
jgi:DNA-directed RNA polymerase beta' subunit